MFGFKRKKPPKNTDSVAFKRYMASVLNGRHIRYVLERESEDTDRIIGKEGFISVNSGELSINCGERTVFRAAVDTLDAWEFLSLEGATLTAFDLETKKVRTVMAYYKYYRK